MPVNGEHFPLLKYLDKLVESLRTLSPRAIAGKDTEAVHDARVASRRLKAAVDLLEPLSSRQYLKPLVKIHRLIRKRLGPLRDLDVMLEHLSKIKAARFEQPVNWLVDRFRAEREKVLDRAAGDLPPAYVAGRLGSWWGLREEIADGNEAVSSLLAESVHRQLDSVAELAGHLVERTEHHEPHHLRIACKELRYTLEMSEQNGAALPTGMLANFKRLQTALGNWHDYVVLTGRVLKESTDADLAVREPELQQAALNLATMLMKRSQRQLGKVSEFWRKDGEELVRSIRAAFPLTAPVNTEVSQLIESVPQAEAIHP
jgi:CHAD domain-containing protein